MPLPGGSANANASETSTVAPNETIGNGSEPPSGKSPASASTTTSAGAASTNSARGERRHSASLSAASASNMPATGLAAAHITASKPASAVCPREKPCPVRPRENASADASANDRPSANASRPIHTSPTAASANATDAQRAAGPSAALVSDSKQRTETSTEIAPTARRPSSHASGGDRGRAPPRGGETALGGGASRPRRTSARRTRRGRRA